MGDGICRCQPLIFQGLRFFVQIHLIHPSLFLAPPFGVSPARWRSGFRQALLGGNEGVDDKKMLKKHEKRWFEWANPFTMMNDGWSGPPQKWMMPVKFQSLIFNSQQAGTKANGNYWWKKSGTGQQK